VASRRAAVVRGDGDGDACAGSTAAAGDGDPGRGRGVRHAPLLRRLLLRPLPARPPRLQGMTSRPAPPLDSRRVPRDLSSAPFSRAQCSSSRGRRGVVPAPTWFRFVTDQVDPAPLTANHPRPSHALKALVLEPVLIALLLVRLLCCGF
jgi:hypothetical protein